MNRIEYERKCYEAINCSVRLVILLFTENLNIGCSFSHYSNHKNVIYKLAVNNNNDDEQCLVWTPIWAFASYGGDLSIQEIHSLELVEKHWKPIQSRDAKAGFLFDNN